MDDGSVGGGPPVLRHDYFFLVAEQVIEVPKILEDNIPQRTMLCEPQLEVVEVSTVVSPSFLRQHSAEQTVVIPVHGGGLPGSVPGRSSTAFSGTGGYVHGCIAADNGGEVRCKGRGAY